MMILPVSGLLMTPEVHYYFQKDYIERLTKEKAQQDEDVLFLIMKEDKKPEEMTAEDFYPVGLMGTVTEVESDGSISVQAKYRVDAEVLGYEDGKWDVSCSLRPDIADMDEQSREQAYKEVQGALLQFVDGFQWGIVARNYVLRWKNLEEMCVALSYQLGLSDEEKYAILAADSLSERYRLMERPSTNSSRSPGSARTPRRPRQSPTRSCTGRTLSKSRSPSSRKSWTRCTRRA